MLEGIEALIALESYGTVSEAATRLRLTQSAVSKRIQALQQGLGFPLTAPDGRRVRLTPEAIAFLAKARPLLLELRSLATEPRAQRGNSKTHFKLALSDSIASSWGPSLIRRALQRQTSLSLELHAHRSVLLIESVRLGRYHVGLCTLPSVPTDLVHVPIGREPFVLVSARGAAQRRAPSVPLITIEESSATWRSIGPLVKAEPALATREFLRVESFSAALQMVRAGFGDGLLPLGIVREARLQAHGLRHLPRVTREMSLVTRKSIAESEAFRVFAQNLTQIAASQFGA